MATLLIPTPFRSYTENKRSLELKASTVGQMVEELLNTYPALKQHLCEENGAIRSFIRIYVEDEEISSIDGLSTAVNNKSVVSIIPAIAGGAI